VTLEALLLTPTTPLVISVRSDSPTANPSSLVLLKDERRSPLYLYEYSVTVVIVSQGLPLSFLLFLLLPLNFAKGHQFFVAYGVVGEFTPSLPLSPFVLFEENGWDLIRANDSLL
jgi:hypothetical protein